MRTKASALCSLLLITPLASGEPVVLGRETNTVPSESYRHYFRQTLAGSAQSPDTVKKQHQPNPQTFYSEQRLLPIHSPSLTPGTVTVTKGIKQGGNHPVCLVGADALSLAWIRRVKPRLLEVGARCLIVNVETEGDLSVLRKALHPLPSILASGEFLAEQHGIRHYPVLISRQGLEQ